METWSQQDYLTLWLTVIDRFVERIVLLDGWQYSYGCITELKHAMDTNLPIESVIGKKLTPDGCIVTISEAIAGLKEKNNPFYIKLENALNA